jgi:hypothetical protein
MGLGLGATGQVGMSMTVSIYFAAWKWRRIFDGRENVLFLLIASNIAVGR